MFLVLQLLVLFWSLMLHELAHGYVARVFGDSTPEDHGRLTFNPSVHVDLFGSVILPALCLILGGPVFGWAKPIPVNYYSLEPRRLGKICVSFAGILMNVLMAVGLGLAWRFFLNQPDGSEFMISLGRAMTYGISLNLTLVVFHLMPVPPLGGWHIFEDVLPYSWLLLIQQNQQIVLLVLFMLFPYIMILFSPLTHFVSSLILGT